MKKHLLISQLLCTAILLSFAGINAEKLKTRNDEQHGAKAWLMKHVTHKDSKKMLANLRIGNEVNDFHGNTILFIPHSCPTYKMYMDFPKHVKMYLDLNATCFEDTHYCARTCNTCPQEANGTCSGSKIHSLKEHELRNQDIEHFADSKEYWIKAASDK